MCLNIQENKKAASSAEKDQENNPESGGASNENRQHSDLLCKSERSTWQTVPPRSHHSRAQTEGIVNHELMLIKEFILIYFPETSWPFER